MNVIEIPGKLEIVILQAGFKPGKGRKMPPAAEGHCLQMETFLFSYVYVIRIINIL